MLIRRKMSTGFISNKIHRKAKVIIRDKEGHHKHCIQYEAQKTKTDNCKHKSANP